MISQMVVNDSLVSPLWNLPYLCNLWFNQISTRNLVLPTCTKSPLVNTC
jgi:hypothetical protein